MKPVKQKTYVNLQSFMLNNLHLTGNELIAYAVIYGFSQDGESKFTGSANYIASWCGCSRNTVLRILKKLTENNLLVKYEKYENGIKLCRYSANLEYISNCYTQSQNDTWLHQNDTGWVYQNVTPPSNKMVHNTIEDTIKPNTIVNTIDYDEYQSIYNSTCSNLPKVLKLTDKRKMSIKTFEKELTFDQWKDVCQKANKSDFLTGKNDNGWKANFDFLIKLDKAVKTLEGAYDGQEKSNGYRNNAESDEAAAEARWGKLLGKRIE